MGRRPLFSVYKLERGRRRYDIWRRIHRLQSRLVSARLVWCCVFVEYLKIFNMFKLLMLIAFAAALLVSPAVAKPQLVVDWSAYSYPTYAYSPFYSYSIPYAYAYSGYPIAYY